jgi:hypothetical protein
MQVRTRNVALAMGAPARANHCGVAINARPRKAKPETSKQRNQDWGEALMVRDDQQSREQQQPAHDPHQRWIFKERGQKRAHF